MFTKIAQFTRRGILSLVAFSMGLSLLVLAACGGGAPSSGSASAPAAGLMVSTFAGTAYQRPAPLLGPASGVVSDGVNLYVTDANSNTIRKIVIATGVGSTLAGKAGVAGAADGTGTAATFNWPAGLTIDSTNTNLYVADTFNHKIRKIVIATGAVSSLTGPANTQVSPGAADGAASLASFDFPTGIATDGANLYVADTMNNKVRTVAIATGVVSSLTGPQNAAVARGAADGVVSGVSFNFPTGVATDGVNVYVADAYNNKIRVVGIAAGVASSVTGPANTAVVSGAADGAAASATFARPSSIATDGVNLYVTDTYNHKIRQVSIATGAVSSVTGTANVPSAAGNADGAAASATFNAPGGIFAVSGNLYVADLPNVRQVALASGQVSTPAPATGTDGTGAAARFYTPAGVVSDGINLYVADMRNNTIRKTEIATGAVTTLAGQVNVAGAADGTGMAATFNWPTGITTDGASLYVTDTLNNKIRKITPASGSLSAMTSANAVVTSLTGTANTTGVAGAGEGAASLASFYYPEGITTDGINLYITDSRNNKIRKVVIATGAVSSLTGAPGVAVTSGAADGAGLSAAFYWPWGITIDSSKTNLYVADTFNNKIRKVVIATGAVSTLTGAPNTAVTAGAADGTASAASFNIPYGITTDGTNLYVGDSVNNKIRKVEIATGAVSSLTGPASAPVAAGTADGPAAAATFYWPGGITVVGSSLYVSDELNNTIRKIQ